MNQPADEHERQGTDAGPEKPVDHNACARRMETLTLALRMVTLNLPQLTGLAHSVRLATDSRITTAAVTPSARVLFNPAFLDSLTLREATFVMAHELYHLVLQTHQRGEDSDGYLVNVAHDLIINDILETELGMAPPAGGLRFRGARNASLERLLITLRRKQSDDKLPKSLWRHGTERLETPGKSERILEDTLSERLPESGVLPGKKLAGGLGPVDRDPPQQHGQQGGRQERDALTRRQELELFPVDNPADVDRRIAGVLEVSIQSVALSSLRHSWERHAPDRSNRHQRRDRVTTQIEVLRDAYRAPWERVVQQWLDPRMPQPRTYARPSRRAGNRTDVVLPGRRRESWIIHVVLDVSGSMGPHLPRVLGALATCCDATGVDQVRVVQCDADITVDEIVPIDELRDYRVEGFTGWEGASVRRALEPPPPPEPPPEPEPEPESLSEPDPPEPPRRRRNKVTSSRTAKVSVSAGHQKNRRRKMKKGDIVRIRVQLRPDLSVPQELSLSLDDDAPQLSMRVEPDSNLAPAMRQLAEEPEVEAVLVLTDGEIEYPAEPMPYDLLWILVPSADGPPHTGFEPGYGQVVQLENAASRTAFHR